MYGISVKSNGLVVRSNQMVIKHDNNTSLNITNSIPKKLNQSRPNNTFNNKRSKNMRQIGYDNSTSKGNNMHYKFDKKRLKELKEVFQFINSNLPPSDDEVIKEIINRFLNETNNMTIPVRNEYAVMDDFEMLKYMLHSVDNAVNFGKMDGLQLMYDMIIKNNSINIKINSIWLIGLSCQNNPKLKNMANDLDITTNILYVLILSSKNLTKSEINKYKKNGIYLDNIIHNLHKDIYVNYLCKLIWSLSSLIRQNDYGYYIFKQLNGTDIIYSYLDTTYNYNNKHNIPNQLSRDNKLKILIKILMLASDIVILNPEQKLFISDKWCNIFTINFNYKQHIFTLREICLSYWNVVINNNYCPKYYKDIMIGLNKLINMDIQDEFDREHKHLATKLLNIIK